MRLFIKQGSWRGEHVPVCKTIFGLSRSRAGFDCAVPGVDSFGYNDMDVDGQAGYI